MAHRSTAADAPHYTERKRGGTAFFIAFLAGLAIFAGLLYGAGFFSDDDATDFRTTLGPAPSDDNPSTYPNSYPGYKPNSEPTEPSPVPPTTPN